MSKVQHELYCKSNPTAKKKIPSFGMLGKTKENGYVDILKNQWSISSYKLSVETRKKISNASKKQVWSEERKAEHSAIMKKAVKENPESYTSSNRGRTKQIVYNKIKFQGKWELEFYKWAVDNGLNPSRCTEGFKYIWNGERTYFPDFYIPSLDLYVEVKGYKTERDDCKWSQFPKKLLVIDKISIDKIRKNIYNISDITV
jgi:hypothetical protein